MPALTLVGLPDKAVAESRERVRSALHALGLALPPKRITINLAPADVAKEGAHYDLPIALALLAAMDIIPKDEIAGYVAMGELALDGTIGAVTGVLPASVHASAHDYGIICAASLGSEAAWGGNKGILAPRDLLSLINHFKGTQVLTPPQPIIKAKGAAAARHVRGQGAGNGEAGAGSGRRRWPQHVADRPTRLGKIHAVRPPALASAASDRGRGAGSVHDPQCRGAAAGRRGWYARARSATRTIPPRWPPWSGVD